MMKVITTPTGAIVVKIYMECYNSEDVLQGLGSAHSIEQCYMQALITETNDQDGYSKFYEMDMEELEMRAREMGIEIKIIS